MNTRTILLAGIALVATVASADSTTPTERGAALLAPFKTSLKAALMDGMQQGPEAAIEICSDKAPGIARGLSTDGVVMGRSSHKLRNPANTAPDWAVAAIEILANRGIRADEVPVTASAQIDLDDGRHGYAEAIFIQPLCLSCHGTELSPEIESQIEALYPEDAATGFSDGDFRGIFWVEFPGT